MEYIGTNISSTQCLFAKEVKLTEDIIQSQEKGSQSPKMTSKGLREDKAGSIKWAGQLAKLLAYKIRDEYRTKWLYVMNLT